MVVHSENWLKRWPPEIHCQFCHRIWAPLAHCSCVYCALHPPKPYSCWPGFLEMVAEHRRAERRRARAQATEQAKEREMAS